jgi:hypothetical protein
MAALAAASAVQTSMAGCAIPGACTSGRGASLNLDPKLSSDDGGADWMTMGSPRPHLRLNDDGHLALRNGGSGTSSATGTVRNAGSETLNIVTVEGYGRKLGAGDSCTFSVSTDGGETWTTILTVDETTPSGIQQQSVTVNSRSYNSDFLLRATLTGNSKTEGCLIASAVVECVDEPFTGPQYDEHGCCTTCGYSWCEEMSTCVQPWMVEATMCPTLFDDIWAG